MHGLFLGAAVDATGQDEDLFAVGASNQFDIDPLLHRLPVFCSVNSRSNRRSMALGVPTMYDAHSGGVGRFSPR